MPSESIKPTRLPVHIAELKSCKALGAGLVHASDIHTYFKLDRMRSNRENTDH